MRQETKEIEKEVVHDWTSAINWSRTGVEVSYFFGAPIFTTKEKQNDSEVSEVMTDA